MAVPRSPMGFRPTHAVLAKWRCRKVWMSDQFNAAYSAPVKHGPANLHPAEVDRMHDGVVESHLGEGGIPEAHTFKVCSGEILLAELGHGNHARTSSGRSISDLSGDHRICPFVYQSRHDITRGFTAVIIEGLRKH